MKSLKEWWIKLAVTVFFIGYCPVGSGTAGALVGVLLFLLVQGSFWGQVFLIFGLLFLGIWLCTLAEGIFGQKDSPRIVLDEVVGFLVTMLGFIHPSWGVLATGFVLSRLFDIFKPFPLRRLEKYSGGWGVMLDDVGAGIYSNLMLRAILAIF